MQPTHGGRSPGDPGFALILRLVDCLAAKIPLTLPSDRRELLHTARPLNKLRPFLSSCANPGWSGVVSVLLGMRTTLAATHSNSTVAHSPRRQEAPTTNLPLLSGTHRLLLGPVAET